MKNNLKRLFGLSPDYILEHRIINAVTLVGIIVSIFSGVMNYVTEMPIITVYGVAAVVFCYIILLIYSILSKNFFRYYYLIYGFMILVNGPIYWIIGAGSLGTAPYFLILTLVLVNTTAKNNANLYFSGLLFLVIIILVFIENQYPDMIIGYLKKEDRIPDFLIGVFLVTAAIVASLKVYMNIYRNALKNEVEQKNLLHEKQKEIQREIEAKETILKDLVMAKEEAEIANLSKSEFLANMSHEIRTPMNAILGFAEIATLKVNEPEIKNYMQIILSSGNALLTIINDILDLSKIEAGKLILQPSYIDIRRMVGEVKQLFTQKINEKGLEFLIEISPDLPKGAFLDEVRVRQVIMNILGNAIKFTEKGFIRIIVEANYNVNLPDEKDDSILKTGKNGNLSQPVISQYCDITISIEDTGIGIPREQIEKIFKPFEQVPGQSTKKFGGTGLGLTISTKLIKMMGGEITVVSPSSESGKGSIFAIRLHKVLVSKDTNADLLDLTVSEMNVEFNSSKILLVDDVFANRELIKTYLHEYNLNIIEAENGEQALEKIKTDKYDLLLLDWRMPGIDGEEVSKILKENENTKDIPIIIFTASALKEEEERISKIVNGFLSKPVNKLKLLQEIKRHLPYSEKNSKPPLEENEEAEIFLTPEQKDKLMAILKGELHKEWEVINKTKGMNSVKSFAMKLQKVNEEYNSGALKRYSSELLDSVNSFKVVKVKTTLNDYQKVIENI
jgi:two-component system, NarL family, sensor histidine kinase EvgS